MGKKLQRGMMVLLSAVFVCSGAVLVRQTVQYRQGEEIYEQAAELVELPDLTQIIPEQPVPKQMQPSVLPAGDELSEAEMPAEEPVPAEVVWVDPYAHALRSMDFAALREANDDVLGWIVIPGTRLSYPLVQGEDNDYYLNRTWRKSRNSVGAIFLDYRNDWGLSDFHTVIYGHRMNDRSMFGQLHQYKDAAYLAANPCIYIADDNGSHIYEIFSVYEADSAATYRLDFAHDEEKQAFLDYCASKSQLDTGVTPGVNDHILTLSTCTGDGHDTRWVVQAVRRDATPEGDKAAEELPIPEQSGEAAEEPPAPEPPPSQDIKESI